MSVVTTETERSSNDQSERKVRMDGKKYRARLIVWLSKHWWRLIFCCASIGSVCLIPIEQKAPPVSSPPKETSNSEHEEVHRVAGLNCDKYGGPSQEFAQEMVYWQDIPSDSQYKSPLREEGPNTKYLTFEPDQGGWNNIRMSMETAVVLSIALGRTLVMPPSQMIYLLWERKRSQKTKFSFTDFFHFASVEAEHTNALNIITFQEFLQREVEGDKLKDKQGKTVQIPGGRTDMKDLDLFQKKNLALWMRTFTTNPIWEFDTCMVGIPARLGTNSTGALQAIEKDIMKIQYFRRREKFFNRPVPVDADPAVRLEEVMAHRSGLCLYNETYQQAKMFHLMGDNDSGARLLVHFYAFLFFEDWKSDLWTKRFVRDHLRYVDEIQCAAARVVKAMREKSRVWGDHKGDFDTMHVRRGDFQYNQTQITAQEILANIRDVIPVNTTIFIATDEKDPAFFSEFHKNYNVFFLNDFSHLLVGVNTNFFGMLDQRIASRGRTFVGCYFSTFTGYINRMRGYHSQKVKAHGWDVGAIDSYYYVPQKNKLVVREYRPISGPMWAREFPIGWRDLDKGIREV